MTTIFVLSVAIGAALVATTACAIAVFASRKTLRMATALRSMTSLQGELIEIRDYIEKVDAWAKRINGRELKREQVAAANSNGLTPTRSSQPASSGVVTKDELRRRAGIIAGRPAPHREDI